MNLARWVYGLVLCAPAVLGGGAALPLSADQRTVLVVVGAAGEPEYGGAFAQQAAQWTAWRQQAGCGGVTLGLEPAVDADDYQRLRAALETEPKEGAGEFWLVLIGHGTFDGQEAKFNLRRPDLSATELALWLEPFKRPLVVINTASSSAPFLNQLSASNRVIITATRSGHEQNYTRFGPFLAEAMGDPRSDLDGDGQTSLLEAFLTAARRVAEFYKTEGRLATEHALIDDNGDRLGTPADWFRGVRAVKRAEGGASLDGWRAHQIHLLRGAAEQALTPDVRARRDALELNLANLRESKSQLAEDDYYRQLEALLLAIARLYESVNTKP